MLLSLSPEKMTRSNLNCERVEALGRMIGQAQNALSSLLELATLDMKAWEDINEGKSDAKKATE